MFRRVAARPWRERERLDRRARSESYPCVLLPRADAELSSERTRRRSGARVACGLALVLFGTAASHVAHAEEPGLRIETGSPDAFCPDLATTRAAVARRLGQLVVPDGSSFTARYTIGHAPSGTPRDFVRLELYAPDGKVQLARDLPLDGESCSTMADAIALVLDRHFRALLGREQPAAPAAPEQQRPPEQQSSLDVRNTQPIPAPGPSAVDVGASAAEPAPGVDSFSAELTFRDPDHPALGGRALFGLWPQGLAGVALHVGLVQDREELPGGAEVTSREWVARAFVAWAPRLGGVDAYVGPGLRLSVAHGAGQGLPDDEAGIRLRPCFGADAGVVWRSGERWVLSASAALDVMVPRVGGWFSVQGVEVLEPAPVRGWLGVGVGYAP